MSKENTNWEYHYAGDGTKEGDMLENIILQVCVERARQGYVNEIEYCKENNIEF